MRTTASKLGRAQTAVDFFLVALLPAALGELVFVFSASVLPHWAQLIVAAMFLAGFAYWAFLYSGERMRKRIETHFERRIMAWYPLAASLGLLLFAVYVFSYLTHVLASMGYADFQPPGRSADWRQFTYLYYWHFFDSVPGLKITDTLLWDPPMTYGDRLSGLLILLFQIAVIGPVMAALVTWYRVRKECTEKVLRPGT